MRMALGFTQLRVAAYMGVGLRFLQDLGRDKPASEIGLGRSSLYQDPVNRRVLE